MVSAWVAVSLIFYVLGRLLSRFRFSIRKKIYYHHCRSAPDEWESPDPGEKEPEEVENAWSLLNCYWLILGAGCDILPK